MPAVSGAFTFPKPTGTDMLSLRPTSGANIPNRPFNDFLKGITQPAKNAYWAGRNALWDRQVKLDEKRDEDPFFDVSRMDKGLAAFDAGASLFSAVQALNAKPTTVTAPKMISMQAPKLESGVEGANALVKENLGTSTNTWLQRSREMGFDPTRAGVGIFGQANRVMRETAVDLTMRNQDMINQQSIIAADVAGKEAMINAELTNRYIERKDQAMAMDAEKRGAQLSQAISNFGAIASRTMNNQLIIQALRMQKINADRDFALAEKQGLF